MYPRNGLPCLGLAQDTIEDLLHGKLTSEDRGRTVSIPTTLLTTDRPSRDKLPIFKLRLILRLRGLHITRLKLTLTGLLSFPCVRPYVKHLRYSPKCREPPIKLHVNHTPPHRSVFQYGIPQVCSHFSLVGSCKASWLRKRQRN